MPTSSLPLLDTLSNAPDLLSHGLLLTVFSFVSLLVGIAIVVVKRRKK